MQDEHGFVWEAMIKSVGTSLAGSRVLDIGCNRGGFPRMLSDRHEITERYGYDSAVGAIGDARRLAGDLPLHFEAADRVPSGWDHFDVAFSHEALYLVNDLSAHALSVFGALAPGVSYYAVMGVHAYGEVAPRAGGDVGPPATAPSGSYRRHLRRGWVRGGRITPRGRFHPSPWPLSTR
jgi:SAM-dependent methyltransferase